MKPDDTQDEIWDKLQKCLGDAALTLGKLFPKLPSEHVSPFGRLQQKLPQKLHPGIKKLEKGMTLLLEFLVSVDTVDPHALSETFTEQLCQFAAIASVFSDNPEQYLALLASGKTLQEIFGIDDDALENLYKAAKYLYEQQHYAEAAAAFSVLTIISPNNYTFWIGLANSEYFVGHYEPAVVSYAMAIHTNPFDPLCHLFSARCYEALNQKDLALNALELALINMEGRDEYASWSQKVTEHKKRLLNT
jgi:type III secretion system low calcium response chaperone LcrH/SycD